MAPQRWRNSGLWRQAKGPIDLPRSDWFTIPVVYPPLPDLPLSSLPFFDGDREYDIHVVLSEAIKIKRQYSRNS